MAQYAVAVHMANVDFTQGIDLDGLSPDEAFAILGNEIRLDTLRVLWHATVTSNGSESASEMTYSELLRGVKLSDSGKFNYHLSKLTPHFVREVHGGYRLTHAGERIARTVVAVSDGDASEFPCTLDTDCPFCGNQITATYRDQHLLVECTECDGRYGDDVPDGVLTIMGFPEAGLTDRTPAEVVEQGVYKCMLDAAYLMHGVCRECAGPIASSVSACEDHLIEADPTCKSCGSPYEVWVEQRCERCGLAKRLPIELLTMGLSAVIAFFYEHGVDVLQPSYEELDACINELYSTSVDNDPFRVQVTIEANSDELTLTMDDSMTVLDMVHRRAEDLPRKPDSTPLGRAVRPQSEL